MPVENFIKNITSKDIKLSLNTIENMIKSQNIKAFQLLCEKAGFIFPFLKERIIKDFVNLIDKENLSSVFEFSRVYCFDFEDLIVNSWLKFASEDLTDEILELFEKYFAQYAFCSFVPFSNNSKISSVKSSDANLSQELTIKSSKSKQ